MTSNKTFWTLVKCELGFDQFSFLQFIVYCCAYIAPWIMINFVIFNCGFDATAFFPGMVIAFWLLWLIPISFFCAYAQVPAAWHAMPNFKAFEFLFTRAVDKKLNFRAKALAILILTLSPHLALMCASPFVDPMTLSTNSTDTSDSIARKVKFVAALPEATQIRTSVKPPIEQISLPHGMVYYAAWLIGMELGLIYLSHAYFAWLGGRLKKGRGWALCLLIAPLLAFIPVFLLMHRLNIYVEDSFILFWRHPVLILLGLAGFVIIVQRYCETKFCQLEIE